jgi:hypothetical protein
MDKTISVCKRLKEMDYLDLVWLSTSEDVSIDEYIEIEVELTLRDIGIQQLQPEVN